MVYRQFHAIDVRVSYQLSLSFMNVSDASGGGDASESGGPGGDWRK